MPSGGHNKKSALELRASGSHRQEDRAREERGENLETAPQLSDVLLSPEMLEVINRERLERECRTLIPGYDPWATAGDAWFDIEAAAHVVAFFENHVRHIEGHLGGKLIELEPWQRAFLGNLFGWKIKDSLGREVRRYRECLLYVPRKNGKTPLSAGLANYAFFCDGEAGAQIYCAAGEREQAALLFRHAKGMVERDEQLDAMAQIYGGTGQRSMVLRTDREAFFKVLSADAETKHGFNMHLGLIDELHVQKNRDLYDVMKTAMSSLNRKQPLIVLITTADYDRPSICNNVYGYAKDIQRGTIDDPTFLPIIYEASSTDDWTSRDTWAKCNPNLGVSVSEEYLLSESKKAQNSAEYQNTFKRLHLNIRTASAVAWMPLELWDAGRREVDWARFEGRQCYGGLDMASTSDLAAFCLVFPEYEGDTLVYYVQPHLFIPEVKAEPGYVDPNRHGVERNEYATWAMNGHINKSPGRVIEQPAVMDKIKALAAIYDLREIGADPYNAVQMVEDLDREVCHTEAVRQGYLSMSWPTKETGKLILSNRIRHDGNPVLRWNVSNVMVTQDAAANIKPDKEKSTNKIDGAVAMIIAVGRAVMHDDGASVYDNRGVFVI